MKEVKKHNQKVTVYLNPAVRKYLKLKAVQKDASVSELINDKFIDELEELEDIVEIDARKGEGTISHEELIAALKADDLL